MSTCHLRYSLPPLPLNPHYLSRLLLSPTNFPAVTFSSTLTHPSRTKLRLAHPHGGEKGVTAPNPFGDPDGDCSERKLDSWKLSESNVVDVSDAELIQRAFRLDFNHLFISKLIGLLFLDFLSNFVC